MKDYQHKRDYIHREYKLGRKHYALIIALFIFAIAYHFFVEPLTIGYHIRHTLFIIYLPVAIGIITLGIYRRKFLTAQLSRYSGFVLKAFMIMFYLVQGIIFSYISFGQVAKMAWDAANYTTSGQQAPQLIYCDINRFWAHRNSKVEFTFQNRYEHFNTTYRHLKPYADKNPKDYQLEILARKGLWGYYIIEHWALVQR